MPCSEAPTGGELAQRYREDPFRLHYPFAASYSFPCQHRLLVPVSNLGRWYWSQACATSPSQLKRPQVCPSASHTSPCLANVYVRIPGRVISFPIRKVIVRVAEIDA